MNHRRLFFTIAGLALLGLIVVGSAPVSGALGAAVVPGEIRLDATYEHIGALWWIEGDDDLDSSLSLEFRRPGETAWLAAAPGMRAYPTIYVQDRPLGLNYWAASAMFLEPGASYELRLTLTDPDGGSETRLVNATTRTELHPDPNGRGMYVVPGAGGGDGSPGNPFKGLQAAAEVAQPGDVFHVTPGTYAPFQLLAGGLDGSPITFLGLGNGSAVIDGAGTDRGVVTLGEWDQTLGYVILEGLTIQNGGWGIDAQHTHDILIRNNTIQDVDFGVYNRRGDALEYNQTLCDNLITGRTPWPGSGIPGERGIDLRGFGNIVCHNTVRNFGDCISVQPSTGASYGNDVYGNDVSYCVDDGIEIDYNEANARVWRNRVMNARMGVSVQPIRGGPAYIFRNEFFNLESVPVKMHNYTTGFYVVHNTGVKHGNGYGDNGAMWRNVVLRNNLFLGTRYAFEFTTVADEGFRDFDYNAWGTNREIDPGGPFFKWDDVRYNLLVDLPTGVEAHGTAAGFSDLLSAALPPAWDEPAEPGSRDLRLAPGAAEIDAGVEIPNLNDPFSLDGAPDIGAFEFGQPLPSYGPRPAAPDLSGTSKQANPGAASVGEMVTYTITIRNTGLPLIETVTLTDTVPLGLAYVPGSLQTASGIPDDQSTPALRWSGDLVDGPVTLTYSAVVTETAPRAITNTALVQTDTTGVLSRSAVVVVNGYGIYLPVIESGRLSGMESQYPQPAGQYGIIQAELPLLSQSALSYIGAFRVPNQDGEGNPLGYSGHALSYNPQNDSLFFGGYDWYQQLCEIGIPVAITLTQTAPILQNCTDVTEGRLDQIDEGSIKLGGTLPYNDRLIISAYSYYDADGSQALSHFASTPDFAANGDIQGPYHVGDWAGIVSGYMAVVPAEWHTYLGGPALTGNCCLSIISRTSFGPAVSVFHPDDVGSVDPIPAAPLLYYPADHPLAAWDATSQFFNGSTNIVAVAFPPGSRSILFFGRQGTGEFCYGTGEECSDPVDPYKGTHAYPYVHQVWAYDALDLLAVRDGTKQPWEPQPYALWHLDEMDLSGSATIAGAAYDPASGRVFITERYGEEPVVHVYQITVPGISAYDRFVYLPLVVENSP